MNQNSFIYLALYQFIYLSSYLPAYEDGTERLFRNVAIEYSDARNYPTESTQQQVNCQLCRLIFRHILFF